MLTFTTQLIFSVHSAKKCKSCLTTRSWGRKCTSCIAFLSLFCNQKLAYAIFCGFNAIFIWSKPNKAKQKKNWKQKHSGDKKSVSWTCFGSVRLSAAFRLAPVSWQHYSDERRATRAPCGPWRGSLRPHMITPVQSDFLHVHGERIISQRE